MAANTTQPNDFRKSLASTAVIVALISSVSALAVGWLSKVDSRCELATGFLMDDKKDMTIYSEEELASIKAIHIGMAKTHCGVE